MDSEECEHDEKRRRKKRHNFSDFNANLRTGDTKKRKLSTPFATKEKHLFRNERPMRHARSDHGKRRTNSDDCENGARTQHSYRVFLISSTKTTVRKRPGLLRPRPMRPGINSRHSEARFYHVSEVMHRKRESPAPHGVSPNSNLKSSRGQIGREARRASRLHPSIQSSGVPNRDPVCASPSWTGRACVACRLRRIDCRSSSWTRPRRAGLGLGLRQIVRNLAAKELRLVELGRVNHRGHALGPDALHDALDGARAEVVMLDFMVRHTRRRPASSCPRGPCSIPSAAPRQRRSLRRFGRRRRCLNQILGHALVVRQQLLGVFGQTVAAVAKARVVVAGATMRCSKHASSMTSRVLRPTKGSSYEIGMKSGTRTGVVGRIKTEMTKRSPIAQASPDHSLDSVRF